jgi:3-mercaptopyruvate sulfurtransferase SseA
LSLAAILRPLGAVAVLLALAGFAVFACAANRSEPFSLVGMDDVQAMLSQRDVAIIDANTRETFVKSHLPGARFYERGTLAKILPADKSTRLVFYCASPS